MMYVMHGMAFAGFQIPAYTPYSLLSLTVMASEEEEEMVTAEMGSPPLQKKSSLTGSLDQIPNRIGSSLSPEPSGNKTDSQDSKSERLLATFAFEQYVIVSSFSFAGSQHRSEPFLITRFTKKGWHHSF